MSKRIDPIRHWSIVLFVVIAVCVGALLLPTIAHYGGWNVDPKTPRDLKYTAMALSPVLVLEFMIWKKFLELMQDWRDKRARKKTNPYDQT